MHTLTGRVTAVSVGAIRPLEGLGRIHQTAFIKEPVAGPVALGILGLAGDEHIYHAHGGVDQALLAYPAEHYGFWRAEHHLDLPDAGAFGENLTVEGLTETEVCIGDTFRVGDTIVQVTSPRTPCYKIGVRFGDRSLPMVMQDTGTTGYLLRVMTEGSLEAGQEMTLIDRPATTVTVAEAARVVARDRDDWPVVERLVSLPQLAGAMRVGLQSRLLLRSVGDDAARLYGEGEGEPVA